MFGFLFNFYQPFDLAITVPSTNTVTNSPTVIQAGENVILLNTPKGFYMRTSDGRIFAIRNQNESSSTQHMVSQPGISSNTYTTSATSTRSFAEQPLANGNLSFIDYRSQLSNTNENNQISNPTATCSALDTIISSSNFVSMNSYHETFFTEFDDELFSMPTDNLFENISF